MMMSPNSVRALRVHHGFSSLNDSQPVDNGMALNANDSPGPTPTLLHHENGMVELSVSHESITVEVDIVFKC